MTNKTKKDMAEEIEELTRTLRALRTDGSLETLELGPVDESPAEPPPTTPEEKELPAQEFRLRVNKGKFFPNDYVVKVQLPTVSIHHRFHEAQLVGESSIIVTMIHGPGVAKGLVEAARKDVLDFHIDFLFDNEIYSTWKLQNAKLKEMSFGVQSKIVPERPGEQFIECGIIFDSACIDGETF